MVPMWKVWGEDVQEERVEVVAQIYVSIQYSIKDQNIAPYIPRNNQRVIERHHV